MPKYIIEREIPDAGAPWARPPEALAGQGPSVVQLPQAAKHFPDIIQ